MPGIKKLFNKTRDASPEAKVFDTEESLTPKEIQEAREAIEKEIEKPIEKVESKTEAETPIKPTPAQTQTTPSFVVRPPSPGLKSPQLQKIENILEQDLHEAFATLDPATKMRFKQEGERTARKIEQLVQQVKVKVKEIINLIRNWLKIIPHVNKYFIEQETKIKVDKIMALRKQ